MNLLFRSVRIIDPHSAFHNQVVDVWIEDGIIRKMGENLAAISSGQEIRQEGLCISPGWCDLRVHAKDPGYEAKEDLYSLKRAAAAGGFTEVVLLPNTKPVVQRKESLNYFRSFSEDQAVQFLPTAALTLGCEGKDFTEMLDLHHAGAVAFTDGEEPIWNADILLKSLQYLAQVNGLLIQRPEEPTLTVHGQMHEGNMSTMLGMRGIPTMAEELMIQRDLRLLEYAVETFDLRPRLHFSLVSTARSVELIRQAKAQGLPVTCDTAAHYLAFTDEDLVEFDTNLKVMPPLRPASEVEALRAALADGTIDALVSDHYPQDTESKNLEFDLADFGISSLETAFATALTYGNLGLEKVLELFTANPRSVLQRNPVTIAEGKIAQLTAFNPDEEWTVSLADWQSKGKNTPFVGKTLRGKVYGVVNQGTSTFHSKPLSFKV
ncbi:dihydroorotase [Siphonobacter sp. BAB-5405]|uniref:dihydroorotase n=1 Tax=Siphonobacter sp. BAB-5405 TaxID=1864825 RepID=UPI000C8015CD|nr:dihydroorotase [Siphonobacter sp. BAB-5405]PMD98425.1 dihydroorotase [Siphonobacter sp. BAB-5405]